MQTMTNLTYKTSHCIKVRNIKFKWIQLEIERLYRPQYIKYIITSINF